MNKYVSFKVSWIFGGRAGESRRFAEWEPAAEFYAGLVGDRRCESAKLVEVTEAELRCFEREAGHAAPPGPAVFRAEHRRRCPAIFTEAQNGRRGKDAEPGRPDRAPTCSPRTKEADHGGST